MESRRRGELLVALAMLPAAIVTGFVLERCLGERSAREALLAYGGAAELFGVLGVASPELVILASLLASGSGRLAQRVRGWLGRRFVVGRDLAAAYEVGRAMPLTVTQRPGDAEPLEDRVAYLYRRDVEIASRLTELQAELHDLPRRWQADIELAVEKLRGEQRRELERQRLRLRAPRLIGVGLLVVGIGLATVGNLI